MAATPVRSKRDRVEQDVRHATRVSGRGAASQQLPAFGHTVRDVGRVPGLPGPGIANIGVDAEALDGLTHHTRIEALILGQRR